MPDAASPGPTLTSPSSRNSPNCRRARFRPRSPRRWRTSASSGRPSSSPRAFCRPPIRDEIVQSAELFGFVNETSKYTMITSNLRQCRFLSPQSSQASREIDQRTKDLVTMMKRPLLRPPSSISERTFSWGNGESCQYSKCSEDRLKFEGAMARGYYCDKFMRDF